MRYNGRVNATRPTSLPPPSRSRPAPGIREEISLPVLKAASIIVILSVFSGLAASRFLNLGPSPAEEDAAGPGAPARRGWEAFSDFGRLEALMRAPGTVLLDARSRELHALGRIPGALSLPAELLEAGDPEALTSVRSLPKGSQLVAYCSEPLCPLAARLAARLAAEGFRRVLVFTPGYDGYLDSGRAADETPPRDR
jgi:rhodanese-related sulfurtransferase